MIRTQSSAWLLSGLTLLASGLQKERAQPGQGQQEPDVPIGKKRERPPSLVKLPPDYIRFVRVPDGGIQPRLGYGKDGALALLYFRGDESKGDLFLTRSADEARSFSPGVRLNPQEGTVALFQGVHGGSVDVGPDGRVYAVWITTGESRTVQYVCEKQDGGVESFQELQSPPGLGTSTAVTVAASGEVYVFYAALAPDSGEPGEQYRIWMQKSMDGQSFSPPVPVDLPKHEVCQGSAIAASVDEVMNTVFVLYRAASAEEPGKRPARDMRLLSSEDQGQHFKSVLVDNWMLWGEPRSGANLSQEATTTLAAWEGHGQVYWAVIRRATNKIDKPTHPRDSETTFWRTQAAAAASRDEVLLTWLERTSKDLSSAPTLGWQLWRKEGLAFVERGFASDPPGSSAPVVFPRAERGFVVVY